VTGRPKTHLLALAAALATAAIAAPAARAAPASFLVYTCEEHETIGIGEDLCRIGPDGRGRRRLTSDGREGSARYDHPALSADGRLLAFTHGAPETPLWAAAPDATNRRRLPTTDVRYNAVNAGGTRLAYVEIMDTLPGEPQGEATAVLHTVNADGGDRRQWARRVNYPTWWGNRLVAVPGGLDGGERVCVMKEGTGECERSIAVMMGHILRHPAVSPDGRLVAAVAESTNIHLSDPGLFLFSTRTRKRVGVVSRSLLAERPAWSPDGQAIAYADGDEIEVVPRGKPEAVQHLAVGEHPTWAGRAGTRRSGLKVTSVSIRGRRMVARGTIAPGARERLHVTFTGSTATGGYSRAWWPRPGGGGRFTVAHTIGDPGDRYVAGCRLVITYPGDGRRKRSTSMRRPRGGVCTRTGDG
jgi:Tol biopolymer transport system component